MKTLEVPDVATAIDAGEDRREAVLAGFFGLEPELRRQREEKLRRILRDDGATHHAGAVAQRSARAWGLELLPALIERERWAPIEAGLAERATLFDLVLGDLYGERSLIRNRVLPPEVLAVYPGFLRECDGMKLPGRQLVFHAVDLIERADGLFCAIADHTQVPAGIGYSLENRAVLSRVVPRLFRAAGVERLSPFFERLRSALLTLAPGEDDAGIVLLSPGPDHDAYFEHAFLANYLGLQLVQSGDLLVRGNRIWLKALEGLTPVDVILRHVTDWACDPLELKSDSLHGVPGLLGVARAGHVRIVNPIGAGVLENPALQAFLPQIGQHFLGREPMLATVPSYWCGDPAALAYVESHLEALAIMPLAPRSPRPGVIVPAQLSAAEQAELRAQLREEPFAFAAQELPTRFAAPAFDPGRPDGSTDQNEGVATRTRAFCVGDGDGYTVMPGGLARREPEATAEVAPLLGTSQDTWVICPEPPAVAASPFLDRQGRFKLAHRSPLPSRVVENLFWLGRYAERAELSLRLLRTVFLALNSPEPMPRRARSALLLALTRITGTRPGFLAPGANHDEPDEELLSILLDATRPGSVRASLDRLLIAAENTKEQLSSDTLRVINDIEDANDGLEAALKGGLVSAPEEALDPLVTALLALAGLTHESMIRGVGWRFLSIGRRLERALQLLTLCQSLLVQRLDDGEEEEVLQALFLTLEMLITYRRRYRDRVELPQGFELLLIDRSNPRSLLFQLELLQQHVDDLPLVGIATRELHPEQRAMLQAITALRLAPLVSLDEVGKDDVRGNLDQLLGELRGRLQELSTLVSERYFEHRVGAHHLVPTVWEGE